MELSKRLQAILSMAESCHTAIDVGTDHGYVPIYLIKNKLCQKVIASDVNEGPVNKAKLNVSLEGLDKYIECRLGSGLKVIKPGEAQAAVIAGMGGNLIRDIIEESLSVFKQLSYAILQPVQNPEVLRRYLYESGYDILQERVCEEDNKFYEVIKARFNSNAIFLEPIYYEISPKLLENMDETVIAFLNNKLKKYIKVYDSIDKETEGAVTRKEELHNKIKRIKVMLSCQQQSEI